MIKILNPGLIRQQGRLEHYRRAEGIARAFKKSIPTIAALLCQGDPLYQSGDEILLVYPYLEGSVLERKSLRPEHASKIASILARIHQNDLSHLAVSEPRSSVLDLARFTKPKEPHLVAAIKANWPLIERLCQDAQDLKSFENQNVVLSHRDFDLKNVLWVAGEPQLIDWETAGLINRTEDLVVTAVYWSLNNKVEPMNENLSAFIQAYQQGGGQVQVQDLEKGLLALEMNWLIWFAHKLKKRGTEKATAETLSTLAALHRLDKQRPFLLKQLLSLTG